MAKFIVILAFVAATVAVSSAASQDEKDAFKALVTPIMQECGKEFGVSKEDVIAAKKAKDINALDACYYACFFKKTGFIDEAGNYNVALAKEKSEKFLSDPEDLKKAVEVADSCTSVNDETVSDGAKGCERAKLLTECLVKGLEVYAASQDEKDAFKALVIPIMQECGKEFGVSKEDAIAAKKAKDINALDACYYACFFKKTGFIDEAGNYNVALAKEKSEKFLSDPENLKKAGEVADSCTSVNDETVSDGAKGCERAKLLTECLVKGLEVYKSLLLE